MIYVHVSFVVPMEHFFLYERILNDYNLTFCLCCAGAGHSYRAISSSSHLNGKYITTEVQDGVGIVTLNDPDSPVSSPTNQTHWRVMSGRERNGERNGERSGRERRSRRGGEGEKDARGVEG